MKLDEAIAAAVAEIERARRKHTPLNSRHEGYAVILEELDELWDEIKADNNHLATREAVQVAAMGLAFLVELCDAEDLL